jgi:hypothetical protein
MILSNLKETRAMASKDLMKRAYDNASMKLRTLVPKDLMNVEFAPPLISNLGRWGEGGMAL